MHTNMNRYGQDGINRIKELEAEVERKETEIAELRQSLAQASADSAKWHQAWVNLANRTDADALRLREALREAADELDQVGHPVAARHARKEADDG